MRIAASYSRGLCLVLLFATFCLSSFETKASHVMGADITYRALSSLKFEVTLKFFRDCRGVPFGNPSNDSYIRCASGGSGTKLSLTLIRIRDIIPVCDTTKKCGTTNTNNSGPGIEEHTYADTIDFNSSPFSNYVSCCKVLIETGQCCRNSAINTGVSGNFYSYAMIDLCKAPTNSSPTLFNDPIAWVCCNLPMKYKIGGVDSIDSDSISYAFAEPLSAYTAKLSYSGNYSYQQPFAAYWPNPLKYPYNNPNANPPIGIYLGPVTGELIYTPTKCDEVTVAVLEMKEWRKDTAGKYELIGITRRDMQYTTVQCPSNYPPEITNNNFTFYTCAEKELCFDITTFDKTFQPYAPDSVRLSWNKGIPAATFTILNKGSLRDTARFCWKPEKNNANSLPYVFVATARDNFCRANAITLRSFRVYVIGRSKPPLIERITCTDFSITSKMSTSQLVAPFYRWLILDKNHKVIRDSSLAYFSSTRDSFSNSANDTLHVAINDTFYLQQTLEDTINDCTLTYEDTIIVSLPLAISLASKPDTFVCSGGQLKLEPTLINHGYSLKFQWGTPIIQDPSDTLLYKFVSIPDSRKDSSFTLTVTDNYSKCQASDTILVFRRDNPFVNIGHDQSICSYDTLHIIPQDSLAWWVDPRDPSKTRYRQGDTLLLEWRFNDSPLQHDRNLRTNKKGMYTLKVTDTIGCYNIDTMQLEVFDTLKVELGSEDTFLCSGNILRLQPRLKNELPPLKYHWATPYVHHPADTLYYLDIGLPTTKSDSVFIVQVTDRYDCIATDTIRVFLRQRPFVNIGQDLVVCMDSILIIPTDSLAWWVDPRDTTQTRFRQGSTLNYQWQNNGKFLHSEKFLRTKVNGIYTVRVTDSVGCTAEDTMSLTIFPALKATLSLSPDTFVCQGNKIKLQAKIYGGVSPLKFQWGTPVIHDFSDTFNFKEIGIPNGRTDSTLTVLVVDQNKCESRDTLIVFSRQNPFINAGPDYSLCPYLTDTLTPIDSLVWWIDPRDSAKTRVKQGSTLKYDWTFNGVYLQNKKTLITALKGLYTVKVTDSLGCFQIDTINLGLFDTMRVFLSSQVDTFVCQWRNLRLQPNFTNAVLPLSYRWATPYKHNPSDTLPYKDLLISIAKIDTFISVQITDSNKCQAWDTVRIFIRQNPTVDLGPDLRICSYDSVQIIPFIDFAYWVNQYDPLKRKVKQGSTMKREWFLDTVFLNNDKFLKTGIKGTYTIKITDSVGCYDSDEFFLNVSDTLNPYLSFGPDTFVCSGSLLRLQPNIAKTFNQVKFAWATPTGHNPADTLPFFDVTLPQGTTDSTFSILVTDNYKCKGWDTVQVFRRDNPTVNVGNDKMLCVYDTALVLPTYQLARWTDPRDPTKTSIPQGDTFWFEWSRNNIFYDSDENLRTTTGGSYAVKMRDSVGCLAFDTLNIAMFDTVFLDLNFTADTAVCIGSILDLKPTIKNTNGPVKFHWGIFNQLVSLDTIKMVTIIIPEGMPDSLLIVTVTDSNTCSGQDSVQVYVRPKPFVNTGPDLRICSYDSVTIYPNDSLAWWVDPRDKTKTRVRQGDTLTVEWSHNGKVLQTERTLNTSEKGIYNLKVSDNLGCFATDTLNLFVNDTVRANAGPDKLRRYNDMVTLTASGFDSSGSKKGTYQWWDISTTPGTKINKGTQTNMQFQLKQSTSMELELFVTEDTTTCFDSDTIFIKSDSIGWTREQSKLSGHQVSIWPNPLSNDLVLNFTILGEKPVSVLIWDLTGKLIASKNEIYNQTGTMTLEAMPAGFYIVEVRSFHSRRFEKLVVQ